jgi:putative RNA 2'-phosphotransferase
MPKPKAAQRLDQFLVYVLGRRPDEFGLVPDAEGFVKIKELLKAVNEEEGWKFVRLSHLKEVALTVVNPSIEIDEPLIRAKTNDQLPVYDATDPLPKLMYTCVRTRAYPAVHERGLATGPDTKLTLATEQAMAERIGRRFDAKPVVLTVQVAQAQGLGVQFEQVGEALYQTDHLPVGAFRGPALPKDKPLSDKKESASRKYPATPGTFLMEPDEKRQRGRAPSPAGDGWKKKGKKDKARKPRRERPPWRR